MYTPFYAVALRTIKHNERSSILTAWSAQLGRLSLIMPAGNGAESRRRRALTMPLGLFEGVVDVRPGRELMPVRDVKPWSGLRRPVDLSARPAAASVAMFVAEVIEVVTRPGAGMPDPQLWQLIADTARLLDNAKPNVVAAVPWAFMMQLADVSGIAPDAATYRPGSILDLSEGIFRTTPPLHAYATDNAGARIASVLMRAAHNYSHLGLLHLNRDTRRQLLDSTVQYFTLHHFSLDKLRSLDILRSLS